MAALRIILPAAAIALTLALFLQLAWPARTPIPRRTSRRGGIGIAVLTAVYAVAAFTGLGSANAPQHFCTLEAGESATLALDGAHGIDTVWYYTGLYTGEYTLAYSDDGITYTAAGTMPQGYADLFKWLHPQPADAAPASAAYVRVTASAHLELGELALLDAQGERIAVREITGPASAAALCDEADTVPASSTYYNSSYFDEIYHARTAYEHLRGVYPYEVSHPPLGKVILSLGIVLFGMAPFGWRCMGALFGVAMLPLMWDLLRRMFRDIDAECYIITDGDDTYPAESAREMADQVLERRVDMVVGDRLSSTYFTENKRPFHNFGNSLVRKSINTLFKNDIKDIMTGYRAFSYEFVKTFPVLSKGFEIETEMSIHAIDKNMFVENVVITYRDRPEGSVSKLDTYSDGFKVLKTIARLYRAYKPMGFFGIIALILAVIATAFFIPVMGTYLATGLVPDFPTLIVCGFTMLSAIQSLFVGVTLETMAQKNRQDFEMQLQRVTAEKKRLCGEKNDAD